MHLTADGAKSHWDQPERTTYGHALYRGQDDRAHWGEKEFVTKESTSKVLFWCAIATQVAGAQIIIWDGRPLYQQLMTGATNVGSRKDYALGFVALAAMQLGYWFAYRLQPHLRFRRNVLVGHLFCCIGEVSFLFIAALGTVVLLDHWREWQFVS